MAANALVAAGLCVATGSGAPDRFLPRSNNSRARPGGSNWSARATARRSSSIMRISPMRWKKCLQRCGRWPRRRLVVVFGCGGDRDAGKRPLMGEIAARLADRVIVTDDNPRSENPAAIRAAILAAAPGAREIGDRRAAIAEAIAMLQEPAIFWSSPARATRRARSSAARSLPFSDHEVMRAALQTALAQEPTRHESHE